ncbi:MAG: SDR family oxidoreductase [Bacteroidota bacterium]
MSDCTISIGETSMNRKVVLITGAGGGIGRVTALHFAKQGWKVAATVRRAADGDDLKNIDNIFVYPLDVTDAESVKTAFDSAIQELGSIDVVVNNAGYGLSGVFEAISEESLRRQFDTNVLGLMRVTRHAIEHMRPRRSGTIIQISSMGGRITFPLYDPYHATKWAVEGFSESLHYELEQFNVRIKLIEPGLIQTNFAGSSLEMVMPTHTSEYNEYVSKFTAASDAALKDAVSPQFVADAVFAAATDGSKRLRYPAGKPAPMILRLRKLVTDSIFFKIVKKTYGM